MRILFWILLIIISIVMSPCAQAAEALSGQADHTPWSGHWWPLNKGELINGYNGTPAPFEKYDLFAEGTYPGSLTHWAENPKNNAVFDSTAEYWLGYCHAWANAALLEPAPVPSAIGKVFFAVGDKKGLLTAAHADDLQVYATCDNDPAVFHRYILEYIGEQKIGIAADLDAGEEIWSHPIYQYDGMLNPSSSFDEVMLNIVYSDDINIDSPDHVGTVAKTAAYHYRLYKDENGDYTGGEWLGDSIADHPDAVWVPLSQHTEIPLDSKTVRTIAQSTDDEVAANDISASAHYPVVLEPGAERILTMNPNASAQAVGLYAGRDPQSTGGGQASYELSRNGQVLAFGSLNEELQQLIPDSEEIAGPYRLRLIPNANNEHSVCIHLYSDSTLEYTRYYLGFRSGYLSMRLFAAGQDPSGTAAFSATVMGGNGLPLTELASAGSLSGAEVWSAAPAPATMDYFTDNSSFAVRLTSDRPFSAVRMIQSPTSLYCLSGSNPNGSSQLIVPMLTSSLNYRHSVFLYLYARADVDTNISYYTNEGEFYTERALTFAQGQGTAYDPGAYPGGTGLNGWAVINDPTGAIIGAAEIREGSAKRDELPLLQAGTKHYLPHTAADANWTTELILMNPSATSSEVVLTLFAPNKDPIVKTETLAAYERRGVEMDASYWGVEENIVNRGRVEATSTTNIAGYFIYAASGRTAAVPLLAEHDLSLSKRLCYRAEGEAAQTGLALINPHADALELSITAYTDSGEIAAETLLTTGPGEKTVFFLQDVFPDAIEAATNFIITGSTTFGGIVLFLDDADVEGAAGLIL